jgi:hypothetical protein
MSARPISRLVTTALAAGAISVAMSVPAIAGSAHFPYGASGVPTAVSGGDTHPNVTAGTDVASQDQQNPIPAAKSTPAISTPVAQPAPTWPLHPVALHAPAQSTTSVDSDFQWGDAGIGAGGALVIVLTALGGVMLVRRRNVADPPIPA